LACPGSVTACHIGTDTLSLLRLGAASVTGLDFSPGALDQCRSLFERAGAAGRFVLGDVFDAAALLGDRYDLDYASIGAINWIPSIGRWLAVAASLLAPGGRVHLRDVHPMAMVIDPETDAGLRLRYPSGERLEPTSLDAALDAARALGSLGAARGARAAAPALHAASREGGMTSRAVAAALRTATSCASARGCAP